MGNPSGDYEKRIEFLSRGSSIVILVGTKWSGGSLKIITTTFGQSKKAITMLCSPACFKYCCLEFLTQRAGSVFLILFLAHFITFVVGMSSLTQANEELGFAVFEIEP